MEGGQCDEMSRFEDEAREALRKVAREEYKSVYQAGKDFAATSTKFLEENDLEDAMNATAHMIRAVEFLEEQAKTAAKNLREVLCAQMLETGGTTIEQAHLSRKPKFVNVMDRKQIPAEYWTTPEPEVDMKRIKKALEDGVLVPECSLVTPNAMTLNIKKAK